MKKKGISGNILRCLSIDSLFLFSLFGVKEIKNEDRSIIISEEFLFLDNFDVKKKGLNVGFFMKRLNLGNFFMSNNGLFY